MGVAGPERGARRREGTAQGDFSRTKARGGAGAPEGPRGARIGQPTCPEKFLGPRAVGNPRAERSVGPWSIEEDILGLSPALRVRRGSSAICTRKWDASGTARTKETAPALDLAARSFLSFTPYKSQLLPNQGCS